MVPFFRCSGMGIYDGLKPVITVEIDRRICDYRFLRDGVKNFITPDDVSGMSINQIYMMVPSSDANEPVKNNRRRGNTPPINANMRVFYFCSSEDKQHVFLFLSFFSSKIAVVVFP